MASGRPNNSFKPKPLRQEQGQVHLSSKLFRQAGKEFPEPSAAPAGKSVKVLDA